MNITSAFQAILDFLLSLIVWMQTHGVYFYGNFFSFYDIELAGMLAAFIITQLPPWRGQFDEKPFADTDDDVDYI